MVSPRVLSGLCARLIGPRHSQDLHRRASIRDLRRAPPRDCGRVVSPHPTLPHVGQRHDAETKERIARSVARYHAVVP